MRLKYSVRLHESGSDILKNLHQHLKSLPAEYSLPIRLNDSGMSVDYSELESKRLVLSFESNSLLIIDSGVEQYARIENWLRLASPSQDFGEGIESGENGSSRGSWEVVKRGKSSKIVIGPQSFETESELLSGFGVFLRIVAATEPVVPSQAADAIWRLFFFGHSPDLVPPGLLLRAELFDGADPEKVFAEIVLDEFLGSDDEVALEPPPGYAEITPQKKQESLKGHQADAASDEESLRELKGHVKQAEMLAQHRLRPHGQDFAWIMKQNLLDRVRDLINTLSRTVGRFSSVRHDPAIRVDWWPQVAANLNFADNEMAIRGLKLLKLYELVSDRAPLPTEDEGTGGLSADEQSRYHDLLDSADMDSSLVGRVGYEASRLDHFLRVFLPLRRAQLSNLVWAEFTKPFVLPTPGTYRGDLLDLWWLRLSNIRYALNIEHRDIIRRLVFANTFPLRTPSMETSAIQLTLVLESVDGNFDFTITPNASFGSFLCGFFTFGLCHVLMMNEGSGLFDVNDIQLAFNISPMIEEDSVVFNVTLDRRHSQVDANVWTIGWNPIADIVQGLVEAILNVVDFFHGPLLDAIKDGIKDVINAPGLTWPGIWNASNGPTHRPTVALLQPGSGILEGNVVASDRPGRAVAAPVDAARVSNAGYVFSPRYLNSWLRKIIGPVPSRSTYPAADFAAHFGVTLADADTIGDPSAPPPEDRIGEIIRDALGGLCGEPPAPLAPVSTYTFSCQRYGPSVQLLPSSPAAAPIAATITQTFVYRLQAHRFTYNYEPIAWPTEPLPGMGRGRGFHGPCEWESIETRSLLATLLVASVQVESELLIGFNQQGPWWLPAIELGVTMLDGQIQLSPRMLRLETNREFDSIRRIDLQNYLFADAMQQTRTILATISRRPEVGRDVVPRAALTGADTILRLYDNLGGSRPETGRMVIEQLQNLLSVRLSGGVTDFQYFSDGNLVYWPVDISQNFALYVRSRLRSRR